MIRMIGMRNNAGILECWACPSRPISYHLPKMPALANSVNSNLSRRFTVSLVVEEHACPVGPEDRTGGWTGSMVWLLTLEGGKNRERFKEVGWRLRVSQ